MDIHQDHTKNHAPPVAHGSHAGHVCHKCGWSFPKPHPSAKHRRAHRKICGTVEGCKFVDSEETSLLPVSDSDEDPKTPSPSVLDRSKNEKESSASGLRSERSEDDMFSDAIAEFSDSGSSPKIEENVANVRESSSNVETVETEDRSVVDRAINVMVLPPSDPADSCSLAENADVPGSHLSDSATDPQHNISSQTIQLDSEISHEVLEDKVASACDPVQLDSETDASLENVKNNDGEGVIEIEEKGNSCLDRDEIRKTSVAVSEVVKTDSLSSDPVLATGVVQMEVEITNEEYVERTNTTLQSDHIKTFVDSGAAMDSVNPRSSTEGNDVKEDENMHVFSVPDTAAVGDAEAMIKGFKDHEGGKFPQFIDGESFEVISDVKHSVPEDNPSIFNSIPLSKGTGFPVEDDLEMKSGSDQIAEQFPVEGETNVALQSDRIKTLVDSGAAMDSVNPRSSTEGNDVKEDENMHVFSVPDTAAVGDAEAMIKGFKDHEGGKFPQFVDGESFEVISDVKHSVPEDNPSIFNSIPLNKGTGFSVEDDLKMKSGSDQIAEQFPVEGETNVALQSDRIKTLVDSGAAMDSVNPRSSTEGNDVKEDENMHVFSVPDTAAVGDAEAMIKGFKDHEGGKFPQFVDGESFEVNSDVKHSVPEDNPSIFNSILLNKGTGFSVEDDLKMKSGSDQIAEQFPVEGETNVALQSDRIKTLVDSGAAMDSVNPRSSTEGNDVKEDENMHVFSVPDTAAVGDAEAMIKGFKDHEGGKFPQFVDGESFEVISDVKHSVPEDNPSIFNSIPLNQGTGFPVEMKSGSDQIAEQFPVEGETNVALQSDRIKTLVDSGAAMDSVNPRSSIEGNDVKEDENMHVFSVPDTAAVGDTEAMIKGFKDHEGGKFPQFVDGESFEVISDVKHSVPEDNPSIFNSIPLNKGTGFPVEDGLEMKSGSNQIAEQFPVEGETNVACINITVNENHSSEGLETLTTEAVETESSHSTQTISAGHDTKALPDVNPIVLPADAEAIQATKSVGKDDNGGYDKTKAERCDIVGNDYNEDNEKNSCTENIIVISEPATVLQELNVTERMNLSGDEHGTAVEVNKIEQSKESGIETVEHVSASVSAEDLSGMSKTSPESMGDLVAQGNAISASEVWLAEPECTNSGSTSDNQDSVKETDKVQVEHVGVVTATTEADNGGEIELLKKSAQDRAMKEPPTSPSETSLSIGNATNVVDNHARDFSTIASGHRSESLTNEGDTNLVVQQLGASVTDYSTDSISQTYSLEGHWGSVSVLSTVSDIPAINDTEPLPSNGSQASVEAENQSSNPKAAFKKQPSDRSDVFEAPSFMTLVESTATGGGDQRAAASEIQSQQGLEQPNPVPLQAGWFPSITHVVNASPGRKKNEELITKVTNWSAGKQTSPLKSQPHTPLKNLLGEANADAKSKSKSPNSKENPQVQKDETTAKGDSALTATVNSILGPQAPVFEPTKKEEGKEWNSPARYPTDIKRERRVKRPYWAQFMCCSSVN